VGFGIHVLDELSASVFRFEMRGEGRC
jgi:hypothetical protein